MNFFDVLGFDYQKVGSSYSCPELNLDGFRSRAHLANGIRAALKERGLEVLRVQVAAIHVGDRSRIVRKGADPAWATATRITIERSNVGLRWIYELDNREELRTYLAGETVWVVRRQERPLPDAMAIYKQVLSTFPKRTAAQERVRNGSDSRFGRIADPGLHFFPRIRRENGETDVELPTPDGGSRLVPIEITHPFTLACIPWSSFVARTYYTTVAEFLAEHFGRGPVDEPPAQGPIQAEVRP